MRKPIIAGNWKMNNTPEETRMLLGKIIPLVKDAQCDIVVCVPFTSIEAAREALDGAGIQLGAQNFHWAEKGAYTGEISADMLLELGVSYVLIGHSERRQYFGETDDTVRMKVKVAVDAGLIPIVCVGERKEERLLGITDEIVSMQVKVALKDIDASQAQKIIIAYEPVWAIGTGLTATDEQANETIGAIRRSVEALFGAETAQAVRIQYGGSMNDQNAHGLMKQPEIDGGLIGGASLNAEKFAKVVHFEREP